MKTLTYILYIFLTICILHAHDDKQEKTLIPFDANNLLKNALTSQTYELMDTNNGFQNFIYERSIPLNLSRIFDESKINIAPKIYIHDNDKSKNGFDAIKIAYNTPSCKIEFYQMANYILITYEANSNSLSNVFNFSQNLLYSPFKEEITKSIINSFKENKKIKIDSIYNKSIKIKNLNYDFNFLYDGKNLFLGMTQPSQDNKSYVVADPIYYKNWFLMQTNYYIGFLKNSEMIKLRNKTREDEARKNWEKQREELIKMGIDPDKK